MGVCQTPKVSVSLALPEAMSKSSSCFTSLPALGGVNVSDFDHFGRYAVLYSLFFFMVITHISYRINPMLGRN